jgi:hypothetical protein
MYLVVDLAEIEGFICIGAISRNFFLGTQVADESSRALFLIPCRVTFRVLVQSWYE